MAVVPTPEQGKPITDFTAGTFDGSSLLFQSRNGVAGKVDGDQVADYVGVNKVYTGLGSKTIPQAIGAKQDSFTEVSGTLTAGQTTITLSDASITATSDIMIFTSPEVWHNSTTPTSGAVTITFDAQANDVDVKAVIL